MADDLRTKREKGEITEEEWSHWTHEIGNEVFAVRLRTLQELKMTRDPRINPQPGDEVRIGAVIRRVIERDGERLLVDG